MTILENLEALLNARDAALSMIDGRMRQGPGGIGDGAKIAYINPAATLRTSDVVVRSFLG
jgi:hypothetical protein